MKEDDVPQSRHLMVFGVRYKCLASLIDTLPSKTKCEACHALIHEPRSMISNSSG